MKTARIRYKKYTIEVWDRDYLAYYRGQLVAGEDTLKQLKATLNKMIKQGVSHESELEHGKN